MSPSDRSIVSLIREVRDKFPKALQADVPQMIDRDLLHTKLCYVEGGTLIEMAGGYSPVSAVLAKLGMNVTVVDTFSSSSTYEHFALPELLAVLDSYGVKSVQQDLTSYDPAEHAGSSGVDRISCYDALYFFNPRVLLERSFSALKGGGKLVVNTNNAVALLKRLRVLLGGTNINPFEEYFLRNVHQRFWTRSELAALAGHLRAESFEIFGRNWSLYQSRKTIPRPLLAAADHLLRLAPSFCNNIYLVATRARATA